MPTSMMIKRLNVAKNELCEGLLMTS